MKEVLVANYMSLGMILTSVALAMICILLSEKVVVRLPETTLLGNILDEWLLISQYNCYPDIGKEPLWYPLQRLHSTLHC